MMAKEIQAMLAEKMIIEKDVQEIEYNMSVKSTEIHNLQSEFDTLAATLKQLTNQKDVAQKRLDALDGQVGLAIPCAVWLALYFAQRVLLARDVGCGRCPNTYMILGGYICNKNK